MGAGGRVYVDELEAAAVLCCTILDFQPGELSFDLGFAGLRRFAGARGGSASEPVAVVAPAASFTTRALEEAAAGRATRLYLSLNVWRTSSSLKERVSRSNTRRQSHTPAFGGRALPSNVLLGTSVSGVAPAPGVTRVACGSPGVVRESIVRVLCAPASAAAIALAGLKS